MTQRLAACITSAGSLARVTEAAYSPKRSAAVVSSAAAVLASLMSGTVVQSFDG